VARPAEAGLALSLVELELDLAPTIPGTPAHAVRADIEARIANADIDPPDPRL